MAESKLFEVYKGLPPWGKGLLVVGALVGVYVAYSTIAKGINAFQSQQDQANRQAQLDTEISTLQNPPAGSSAPAQVATYQPSQYAAFADAIQAALSGVDLTFSATLFGILSDDGTQVKNVFDQLNNDVDYLMTEKAFGTRTLTKSWIAGGDIANVDMTTAINRVLDPQEISYLNTYLAGRGFTYKL